MEAKVVKVKATLHTVASDSTDTLGLGALTGATSMQVVRNANQIPQLTMTYKADAPLADELVSGRVIVCAMGKSSEEQNQKFRIINVSKDVSSMSISVTANHIAGDLSMMPIYKNISIANATPKDTFKAVMDSLAYGSNLADYKFTTDIQKVANVAWQFSDVDNANSIFLGDDQVGDTVAQTMQAIYSGQWKFNNYHWSLLKHAGHDSGIIIKYGRNMLSAVEDHTTDSTYNAIMPYASYTPNTTLVDGTNEAMEGMGTVQYLGSGGAEIYDKPTKGNRVVGHVQNGAYYKVTAKAEDNTCNGNVWYNIGEGWIDEHFFTFDKSGNYVINSASGQGTIKITSESDDVRGIVADFNGVGTVTYSGLGGVLLWSSPLTGSEPSSQYVSNGSRYIINKIAYDEDGSKWYCLGNDNQWIPERYFSLTKSSDYVTTPTTGILHVKADKVVSAYGPSGESLRSDKLAVGSFHKIIGISKDSAGTSWYEINPNCWVKGDDNIDFTQSGSVSIDEDASRKAVVQTSGKVIVYDKPNGTQATGRFLWNGAQVKITGQSDSNGRTYYRLSDGGWVESTYFDFASASDIPIANSSGNTDTEVETQTIMLDPPVLVSQYATGQEALRVQTVDLSSYNIGNDRDKLKTVAEQYMREYRIGRPNYSLTVEYPNVEDEFSQLRQVDLYDYVGIQVDELNILDKAMVNSVTYDVLLGQNVSVTIGQLPLTYEHLLGQMQKETTKQLASVEKNSTHLFGQMNQALKLQGDAQKTSIMKVAQDLQMTSETYTRDYDKLQSAINSINSTVTDVQGWINSGGSGVITAYPNWANPTELRAKSANGGYLQFNGNGIMYVGKDGILRSSIDSQGRTVAESITAGTIKGLTLEGVEIKSSSEIHSNGKYATVMSGVKGFSCDSDDGHIGINSTTIYLNSTMNAGITKSYIRLINDKTGRDVGLTGFEFSQLKELLRKNGMETSD